METITLPNQSFPESVREYNRILAYYLRREWNVSLHAYKIVKSFTNILALVLVGYVVTAGADPTIALIVIGGIILGWDFLEAVLVHSEAQEAVRNALDERDTDE